MHPEYDWWWLLRESKNLRYFHNEITVFVFKVLQTIQEKCVRKKSLVCHPRHFTFWPPPPSISMIPAMEVGVRSIKGGLVAKLLQFKIKKSKIGIFLFISQLLMIPGLEGGVGSIKGRFSAKGKLDQFNSFSDRPIYPQRNCSDWKWNEHQKKF